MLNMWFLGHLRMWFQVTIYFDHVFLFHDVIYDNKHFDSIWFDGFVACRSHINYL